MPRCGPGQGPSRDAHHWTYLRTHHKGAILSSEWALAAGHTELAIGLAGGRMRLWEHRGCYGEARQRLERVLAATEAASEPLRAAVLHDAGFAAVMVGDLDTTRTHLHASLALADNVPDRSTASGPTDSSQRRSLCAVSRDRRHLRSALHLMRTWLTPGGPWGAPSGDPLRDGKRVSWRRCDHNLITNCTPKGDIRCQQPDWADHEVPAQRHVPVPVDIRRHAP